MWKGGKGGVGILVDSYVGLDFIVPFRPKVNIGKGQRTD